jgi:predicted nucleotidyltransferase
MSHDEHCRPQQDILRRVIDVCRDDPHVVGLTVFGSYTRGANDAFSDLDLDWLEHGFRLRHCREVPFDVSHFQSLGPAQTEFGTRIAVDGLPLVLILWFQTAGDASQR